VGRLSPTTMNCYRSRVRKLRKILPLMKEDDPERPKVVAQIEKLTNQLGMEMTDLEIALARGPGRPRTIPDVRDYEEVLKRLEGQQPAEVETDEQRKERAEQKRQELYARVEAEHPELKRSAEDLEAMQRMMQHGGDNAEEHNADVAPTSAGSDQHD